ncbi:uncharacterized protein LOC105205203 [Solenopsis invicta]|uniref:uncharacterized protein LOC105205203 n=1 Tax=Solenopsis invicta TaxID=13686 RepID=UPI0005959EA2|nr:uncharacterized protein LOC105205203 [Solenopsis invicta]
MVSSCCICSKENNPLEPHRSFHRIPANEEMKKKWLHIIGRTVSYKGARVCSDHFTENDYNDINPYSRVKRLKNTAVPSVIVQKKENVKRKSLPFQKTAVNLYTDAEIISQNEKNAVYLSENLEVDDSETKHSESTNNELVLTQDTSENFIIFLNSEKEINVACIDNQKIDVNFETNINDTNKERKLPSELANSKMRKVLLKFSKHGTVCFTKTDFSSNEKWKKFLKCITYKSRENRIMRRRNKCLQKKILVFQDMLQDLLKKV